MTLKIKLAQILLGIFCVLFGLAGFFKIAAVCFALGFVSEIILRMAWLLRTLLTFVTVGIALGTVFYFTIGATHLI